MITAAKLIAYVVREPFRPFRIKMASGETFEVRHPEMIGVGKVTSTIYEDADSDQPFRAHKVSMLLMESVEQLHEPSPAEEN